MSFRDHVLPQRARLDPRRPQDGIYAHATHPRRVYEQVPIGRRPYTVAGRHDSDAKVLIPRKTHRGEDVGRALGHDHHGRPLVRVQVPGRARIFVALLARTQQRTP